GLLAANTVQSPWVATTFVDSCASAGAAHTAITAMARSEDRIMLWSPAKWPFDTARNEMPAMRSERKAGRFWHKTPVAPSIMQSRGREKAAPANSRAFVSARRGRRDAGRAMIVGSEKGMPMKLGWSDVTPRALYLNRRTLMAGAAGAAGLAVLPARAAPELGEPNTFEEITN